MPVEARVSDEILSADNRLKFANLDAIPATSGYIFASVTLNSTPSDYFLIYQETTTKRQGQLMYRQDIEFFTQRSPLADGGRTGNIVYDVLPEGHYALTGWRSVSGGVGQSSGVFVEPVEFDVKPGVRTYLGSFYFEIASSMGMTVTGTLLSAEDHHDRDLALDQKQHPQVSTWPVRAVVWEDLPHRIKASVSGSLSLPLPIILKH